MTAVAALVATIICALAVRAVNDRPSMSAIVLQRYVVFNRYVTAKVVAVTVIVRQFKVIRVVLFTATITTIAIIATTLALSLRLPVPPTKCWKRRIGR